MRASKKISDLEDWDNDEERIFWRSKQPTKEVKWVYFIRKGFIIGRALYSDYKFVRDENLQGEIQEGGAFVLKGPLIEPKEPIKVLLSILLGRWSWCYIKNEPLFYPLIQEIEINFQNTV